MYDTATAVRRLKDNASDKFLDVVTPTDIASLLSNIPKCVAIVTTGQKATDVLAERYGCAKPQVGENTDIKIEGKIYTLYRLPSTSRAYPLPLEKKAKYYRKMYMEIGLL